MDPLGHEYDPKNEPKEEECTGRHDTETNSLQRTWTKLRLKSYAFRIQNIFMILFI